MPSLDNSWEQIRKHLRGLKKGRTARPRDIARSLGLEPAQVSGALTKMLARGEVERPAPAQYRLIDPDFQGGYPAPTREKIWRAMHVSGTFSTSDLVVLTDAHVDTVRRVAKELTKAGDLEYLGRHGNPITGEVVGRWRVRDSDQFWVTRVLGKKDGGKSKKENG